MKDLCEECGASELEQAALKAMKATNYCTKHSQYHGQKYKSCTPQERVMIEVAGGNGNG